MIVDVREFSLFINVETNLHFLFDKSIFGFFSGRTARLSSGEFKTDKERKSKNLP